MLRKALGGVPLVAIRIWIYGYYALWHRFNEHTCDKFGASIQFACGDLKSRRYRQIFFCSYSVLIGLEAKHQQRL